MNMENPMSNRPIERTPESPIPPDGYEDAHEKLQHIFNKHVDPATGEPLPDPKRIKSEQEQLEDLRRAKMDEEALRDPNNVPRLPPKGKLH
jgi:hypothetical protein